MKFPYLILGNSSMPVIPITLSRGDRWIATEALVDSGAASSIFDAQFAVALGIGDVQKGSKIIFEGVSGHTITAFRHPVRLSVGGRLCPKTMIAFTEDMPDNAVNILGQQGFFEFFRVTFHHAQQCVDIDL